MRIVVCSVALVLMGVLALTAPAPGGVAASSCAPPRLGYGVGEGANEPGMPPTVGELRVAMLLVDFADRPATDSPEALVDAYVPSTVAWYRDASYGRLRLVVDPLRRWLRLPRSLEAYESAHFEGAIDDVLAVADPHYDFGGVDALYLITSQEAGSLASAVIDHVPRRVDGVDIRAWVWLASGGATAARSSVLIHETGHVLGLPDLYDLRRPGAGHHHWDIMSGSGGAGMLAWHRWKLGWLTENDILCLTRQRPVVASLAALARLGGRKAIVYRMRSAAVVVEVRSRSSVDRSLCKPGVLVYRVDFRKGDPSSIGRLGVPIDVWQARPGSSPRCGAEWRAPLSLGRGNVARAAAFGVEVRVLRKLPDGAYRVRASAR
jgi:M6 family metalloprotease-like protein